MMPNASQTPLAAKIRVIMRKPMSTGNLKALADVMFGNSLIIYGFRIVQQPRQKPWISPPQREWIDDSGKRRYTPMIELRGSLKSVVDQAILAVWQAKGGRDEQ